MVHSSNLTGHDKYQEENLSVKKNPKKTQEIYIKENT